MRNTKFPAFAELPNFWTPVLSSDALRDRPVPVVVAGERIVLFRGADGPAALVDRCPHRGVALSLGQVEDGCLACPFHGWRFASDGTCTRVPFNPGAAGPHLSATALPTRDRAGLVWVFTGASTDTEPTLPEVISRPAARLGYLWEDWDTHWTRVMENMLDTPHLPFVHKASIGADMARRMRNDSRLYQEIVENDVGFEIRFRMDEAAGVGRLEWVRPNGMVLHILDEPTRVMRMHVWCVPMETNRTRLLLAAAYDFGALSGLMALATPFNRKVVFEDRAVVESSRPHRVPPLSGEANVPSDLPTLRFRRWYYETIVPGLPDAPA